MRKHPMLARAAALLLLSALASARAAPAPAVDLQAPMLLVATGVLDESPFHKTVLLVAPNGVGGHFGFVLNRPTHLTVASLFPGEEAAQRLTTVVGVGGPTMTNAMFALVRGEAKSQSGLLTMTPQVFAALNASAVDRVIADQSADARFFVGLVVWQRDDLANQLQAGAWDVASPETDLVLSTDADGLWEQLVQRAHATLATNIAPKAQGEDAAEASKFTSPFTSQFASR